LGLAPGCFERLCHRQQIGITVRHDPLQPGTYLTLRQRTGKLINDFALIDRFDGGNTLNPEHLGQSWVFIHVNLC